MTAVEFRMFFDSLPDADSKAQITKNTFARECDISMTILKEIAAGKKKLTEDYISRLLPVMREHGFQG
jgi:plasmid maintenance system antidote protein VapI